jgi:glycosyltransferase involved in cell wall biosynthesis
VNSIIQAEVRIYLFTYRRHNLLPRAVASLLDQTHKNWICELHNDDPEDSFPEKLAARVNDPRIEYARHKKNLGPTATFNLAFQSAKEPYVSILEDDNWWEPTFLARMISIMARHPDVTVGWANMWLSKEGLEGGWQRQGTIWPVNQNAEVTLFKVPDPRQVCSAIHSNGAMLVRNRELSRFVVPPFIPFFAMEAVRDRLYPGPLLLANEPLANFAITRTNARGETADQNMQILVLLTQTFLAHAMVSGDFYRQMWTASRGSLGHKHRALLVAALNSGRFWEVVRGSTWADLCLVLAWALRHPLRFGKLFRAAEAFPDIFNFLNAASRSRSAEWNANPNQSADQKIHDTRS